MLRELKDTRYKIKCAFQRMFKGYSIEDTIDIENYFKNTFYKIIKDFKPAGSPMLEFKEVETFDINWIIEIYNKILEEYKEYDYLDEEGIYDDFVRWLIIIKRIEYCIKESSEINGSLINQYEEPYVSLLEKEFDLDNPESFDSQSKEIKKAMKKYVNEENKLEKIRQKYLNEAFQLLSKYLTKMVR